MLLSSDWKLHRIISKNLCGPAIAQELCDKNCFACPLLREVKRPPNPEIQNHYAFVTWKCRDIVAREQELASARSKEDVRRNKLGEVIEDNPFLLIGEQY